MKKLILLFVIAITILSCSTEEVIPEPYCDCNEYILKIPEGDTPTVIDGVIQLYGGSIISQTDIDCDWTQHNYQYYNPETSYWDFVWCNL